MKTGPRSRNSIRRSRSYSPRLIQGIMSRDLPWGLVIIGAVLAIVMQLCGVSALAYAVGVYLPLSTTLPIFVGGMVRKLVDKSRGFSDAEADMSPGTLMSTGLIAGGSLAGIIVAFLIFFPDVESKARLRCATGRRRDLSGSRRLPHSP